MKRFRHYQQRSGHTLMELVVAMVASAMLLAGLGSVMLIARQVAYTPSAAVRRTEAADVVNALADELRCATLILQQSPRLLEFVVADRYADGTAEKIRYEWSGTSGDPLQKSLNGAAPVTVLDSIEEFQVTLQLQSATMTFTTTTDSAEAVLASNTALTSLSDRNINITSYAAQRITPADFAGVPANALYWNANKVEFYSSRHGPANETLLVQLRATGDPNDGPTSYVFGQVSVPENTMTDNSWNVAVFPNSVRQLPFQRKIAVVWSQSSSGANAAVIKVNDAAASGVSESDDAGASWQYMPTRQMFYRLYGTYTTPGTTYNVTRNCVSHVRLVLQSGTQTHARIDASVPLVNVPELLSAYWRADFDANPTTTNANGDAVADWAMAGGGTVDSATLIDGLWHASGALETRPPNDFTLPTIVDVCCRNTTVGGNGAVVRINADRQGGLHAPLLVYVQLQADGTQTLTLYGKSSDAATSKLFARTRLSSDFVRFRLTIVPQSNVVNLQINDEDQGAFTYPTYAPSSSDRFLTLFADTSLAEFDYVDVRVATN